ncbi:MAG: hypothetical protein JWN51_2991 [Phycisphaerales bacterium]|nr:hypothetical protein [Phycisphaerales bacterium]
MVDHCPVCGSRDIRMRPILWPELIAEWRLEPHEVEYVDRQQGQHCGECFCNVRSMVLAVSVMRAFRFAGLFQDFVLEPAARELAVLEINEAGALTHFFARLPGRHLACHPQVDMMNLPYDENRFDLVIHSDTLEHVADPVRGLSECRRVLKTGGLCVFTVPIVVGRMTISRTGMPPSYHGDPSVDRRAFLVNTEYGCDAWAQVIQAGFAECRIVSLDYPTAQALTGVK